MRASLLISCSYLCVIGRGQAQQGDDSATGGEQIVADPDPEPFDLSIQIAPAAPPPIVPAKELFIVPVVASPNDSSTSKRSFGDDRGIAVGQGVIATTTDGKDGNNRTYPTDVDAAKLITFLTDARLYGFKQNKIKALGLEEDKNYFPFTKDSLSLVCMARGDAAKGDRPFNWDDYTTVADRLLTKTKTQTGKVKTWAGYLTDANIPVVDIVVTDAGADTNNAPQKTIYQDYLPAFDSTIGGTRRRLAKRTTSIVESRNHHLATRVPPETTFLALGAGIYISIKQCSSRIKWNVMGLTIKKASTIAFTDSANDLAYDQQFLYRLKDNPLGIFQSASHAIFQLRAAAEEQIFTRGQVREVVGSLAYLAEQQGWEEGVGETKALYGEVFLGDVSSKYSGQRIAIWSLGQILAAVVPCVFETPDKSIAYGCFHRYQDEL